MDSPRSCHTIKTVWPKIEPFIDLPSTVADAQACRTLRGEIVDADTLRIKVSHYDDSDGPWDTVPNYAPSALNAIHFPSLRRISLRFSGIMMANSVVLTGDSTPVCFPLFVSQLASAGDLESLDLDLNAMMEQGDFRSHQQYVPLIELLSRNLARYKNLKDLTISAGEYGIQLVRALALALTPTLKRQRDVMRLIEFRICHGPLDEAVEENLCDSFRIPMVDFFRCILCCSDLHSLDVHVPHSSYLSNAFLEAMRQMAPRNRNSPKRQRMLGSGSNLHRLCLCLHGMYDPSSILSESYLEDAEILLRYFSTCVEIEDVRLGLHRDVWNVHSGVVASLLNDKPKLSALTFYFGHHHDNNGKALELLKGCRVDKESGSCKIGDLQVFDLDNVDGTCFLDFVKHNKNAGGTFRDFSVSDSHHVEQDVKQDDVGGNMPEEVDIRYLWMRNAANFGSRERSLGLWY